MKTRSFSDVLDESRQTTAAHITTVSHNVLFRDKERETLQIYNAAEGAEFVSSGLVPALKLTGS